MAGQAAWEVAGWAEEAAARDATVTGVVAVWGVAGEAARGGAGAAVWEAMGWLAEGAAAGQGVGVGDLPEGVARVMAAVAVVAGTARAAAEGAGRAGAAGTARAACVGAGRRGRAAGARQQQPQQQQDEHRSAFLRLLAADRRPMQPATSTHGGGRGEGGGGFGGGGVGGGGGGGQVRGTPHLIQIWRAMFGRSLFGQRATAAATATVPGGQFTDCLCWPGWSAEPRGAGEQGEMAHGCAVTAPLDRCVRRLRSCRGRGSGRAAAPPTSDPPLERGHGGAAGERVEAAHKVGAADAVWALRGGGRAGSRRLAQRAAHGAWGWHAAEPFLDATRTQRSRSFCDLEGRTLSRQLQSRFCSKPRPARQAGGQAGRQAGRRAGGQAGRHAGGQAGRQSVRQARR